MNNMKKIILIALLIVCIGVLGAIDLESYQFIDFLLNFNEPQAPQIYEDAVVFTASSSGRRVGISFAHEGFSKVHWFRQLMLPMPSADVIAGGRNAPLFRDSGMLFHVETIPDGLSNLDYRMIIDGLWTVDPLNTHRVSGSGGLIHSRVSLPQRPRPPSTFDAPAGHLNFAFTAPPGQIITVAGTFNNWDPFMYEMRETRPGSYSLLLALPPGTYQYVFFFRG